MLLYNTKNAINENDINYKYIYDKNEKFSSYNRKKVIFLTIYIYILMGIKINKYLSKKKCMQN